MRRIHSAIASSIPGSMIRPSQNLFTILILYLSMQMPSQYPPHSRVNSSSDYCFYLRDMAMNTSEDAPYIVVLASGQQVESLLRIWYPYALATLGRYFELFWMTLHWQWRSNKVVGHLIHRCRSATLIYRIFNSVRVKTDIFCYLAPQTRDSSAYESIRESEKHVGRLNQVLDSTAGR